MPSKILILLFIGSTLLQAQVQSYDVLITEIMADPNPSVGLPVAEYIELYNQTSAEINLGELTFRNGSRTVALPDSMLGPDSYVLVCDEDDREALEIYGDVLGMESFPGLTNNGDEVELLDRISENQIHKIVYDMSWYNDKDKNDGGWSLEMINPSDACALASNWGASQSLIGGTPAAANSILNRDSTTNFAVVAILPSTSQIAITFNKQLPQEITPKIFLQGHTGIQVLAFEREMMQSDVLTILLEDDLEIGIEYSLTIDDLRDCLDQGLRQNSFSFLLPIEADPGDLLINEVLFNPTSGGSDFIELFNPTQKFVRLSSLFIANLGDRDLIEQITVDRIHAPGEYLVLCSDPNALLQKYAGTESKNVLKIDLPALANDAGNVTLYRVDHGNRLVIDAFDYREEYHLALLRDEDGVSLERISFDSPTNDPANWQSAAEDAGFATPTARNSQSISGDKGPDMFSLMPQTFSPDGDGYEDFLLLHYNLQQTGMRVHVRIFDAAGRAVRDLANQISISTEGFLKWDGTNDAGAKSPMGIYTILAEGFSEKGDRLKWSGTCVLANRL